MRAVTISEPGGPEVLGWGEVPDPVCGAGEVIIDVAATAVNRADLLQRQGHYPPPDGASDIIGLECSGTVAQLGDGDTDWQGGGTLGVARVAKVAQLGAGVTGWQFGDPVCALLAGGGYAEKVRVPAGQLMP